MFKSLFEVKHKSEDYFWQFMGILLIVNAITITIAKYYFDTQLELTNRIFLIGTIISLIILDRIYKTDVISFNIKSIINNFNTIPRVIFTIITLVLLFIFLISFTIILIIYYAKFIQQEDVDFSQFLFVAIFMFPYIFKMKITTSWLIITLIELIYRGFLFKNLANKYFFIIATVATVFAWIGLSLILSNWRVSDAINMLLTYSIFIILIPNIIYYKTNYNILYSFYVVNILMLIITDKNLLIFTYRMLI